MQKSQSVRGPVRLRASGDNELSGVTVKTVIHVCLGTGPFLGQGKEELEAGKNPS